ncbi:hypothetical protein [Verrucomicrobium spinosum]|uniref:hypothetical protein n=1 Tax=Verrucomicrobium spinosum TaxID=2736 RepID=UPI0002D2F747|nr:hypothetical protein [Verrucomicrobium spinosum]
MLEEIPALRHAMLVAYMTLVGREKELTRASDDEPSSAEGIPGNVGDDDSGGV